MIFKIKNDPCCSFWIRQQVEELNERDVVDVLKDLQLLTRVYEAKFQDLLEK